MNADQIVEHLNAIEANSDNGPGHNSAEIWEYIQSLDEWDVPATQALDPANASDRFALADGTVIRYDGQRKRWQVQR